MSPIEKPNMGDQLYQKQRPEDVHGGDIISASEQYSWPLNDWIDLSTGLNPWPYPVPNIPQQAFIDLPYLQAEFNAAVQRYYGNNNNAIALSGSQQAIQALPYCLNNFPLLAPEVGYQEHVKQWRSCGGNVAFYPAFDRGRAQESIQNSILKNSQQHVLIINPNNPTGLLFDPEWIRQCAYQLAAGGFVIVDEAFIDTIADQSMLQQSLPSNVIVLRSFGKFFGLAGLRLGFVFAPSNIRQQLQQQQGLWSVNGPAQYVATQALKDHIWQQQACRHIVDFQHLTVQIFAPLWQKIPLMQHYQGPLFNSYLLRDDYAASAHIHLAERGILTRVVRLNNGLSLLRIGLLSTLNNQSCVRRLVSSVNQFLS